MKKSIVDSKIMRYFQVIISVCLSSYAYGIDKCEYCQYPNNLHKVDSKFVCKKHYCAKHDLIRPPLKKCELCVLEASGLGKSKCVICGSRDQLMIKRWLDGGEHSGTEHVVVCSNDYCSKHGFVMSKHEFKRKDRAESEICCKLCHDELPKLKKDISQGKASTADFGDDVLHYVVSLSTDGREDTGVLVNVDGKVYLYTSWNTVYCPCQIVAKDYLGRNLCLGDFELCRERGLVRFSLHNVLSGLTLAQMDKQSVGSLVVSYDTELIRGFDSPNCGRITSLAASELNVQLERKPREAGSILVNSDCDVVGIIFPRTRNSGNAVRMDAPSWDCVAKEKFRKSVSRLEDALVVFRELDEFYQKIGSGKRLTYISRPSELDSMYKGNSGYPLGIKSVYESWSDMMGYLDQVASMNQNKTFPELFAANDMMKKAHLNYRWATVSVPACIMTHVTNSMATIKAPYFSNAVSSLESMRDVLFKYVDEHKRVCDSYDRADNEEYQRICKAWEPVRKEIERKQEEKREREKFLDELEKRIERNAEAREVRMAINAAAQERRIKNAVEDAQEESRRQNWHEMQNLQMQQQNQLMNMQMQQQNEMNLLRSQLGVW